MSYKDCVISQMMKPNVAVIPTNHVVQYHLGKLTNSAVKAIKATTRKPAIPIMGFGKTKTDDCHEFIGPWQLNKGFQEQVGM